MGALPVAKYFISKSREADKSTEYHTLTPLKLQKILYYAQGWYLGITGKPLFDDPIFAWKKGPVVKTVYNDFKHLGDANISETDWNNSTGQVEDPHIKKFLDRIWHEYAEDTASELVNRTHSSDPWLNSYANPYSKEITIEELKEHFGKTV